MKAKDIISEVDTVNIKNVKALLRDHPEAIFHMHDPSKDLILYAIGEAEFADDIIRRFKKTLGEDAFVLLLKEHPFYISEINNPSERLQLIAVEKSPSLIEYIKKPTIKVQMAVLDRDPKALSSVKKIDPAVIKLAVERGLSKYLPHVVNLTDAKTQLDAVKLDLKAVEHIKDMKPAVLKWVFSKNKVDAMVDAVSNASLKTIDESKTEIIKFILRCMKTGRDMSYPYEYPNMKSFLFSSKHSLIKWLLAKGVKWQELEVVTRSLKAVRANVLGEDNDRT